MKKVGLYIGLLCFTICAVTGCSKIQESSTESENDTETIISESEEDSSTQSSEEADTAAEPNTVIEGNSYSVSCPTGASVEPIYAINELPAMENQYYAKWDNNIYFRQYNAESFEDGALWADIDYSTEALIEKDLMCMDALGNITRVGSDYGYGPMYIIDADGSGPKIYSTLRDKDNLFKIYSCDLNGDNIEYLYSSESSIEFYGHHEDKIAFLHGYWDICYIDAGTDSPTLVDLEDYSSENWIGMDADGVYFMGIQDENFHICRASYAGELEVLAEIPLLDIVSEDLMDLFVDEDGNLCGVSDYSVPDADFIEDKIYFMIMSYQGTGHMPISGAVYELNKTEGSCNKIFMTTTATEFQIVKQDDNAWIYYPASGTVEDEWKRWTECVQFAGVADAEAPSDVDGTNDLGSLHMGHYATDEGYHLYATPDSTGCSYIVLTVEEINALGIENPLIHKETSGAVEWNIVRAEYVGDKLFFSVEISDHDIEQNIGWRDFYVRRITYDYYKDLSTGEIVLLQSY